MAEAAAPAPASASPPANAFGPRPLSNLRQVQVCTGAARTLQRAYTERSRRRIDGSLQEDSQSTEFRVAWLPYIRAILGVRPITTIEAKVREWDLLCLMSGITLGVTSAGFFADRFDVAPADGVLHAVHHLMYVSFCLCIFCFIACAVLAMYFLQLATNVSAVEDLQRLLGWTLHLPTFYFTMGFLNLANGIALFLALTMGLTQAGICLSACFAAIVPMFIGVSRMLHGVLEVSEPIKSGFSPAFRRQGSSAARLLSGRRSPPPTAGAAAAPPIPFRRAGSSRVGGTSGLL